MYIKARRFSRIAISASEENYFAAKKLAIPSADILVQKHKNLAYCSSVVSIAF